ncbi:STAS domain-containing protein [Streptomyces sp. NPDC060048]|uniref:STAS domain-containing protein n=1 Tax=unclassified Streptomyces TaxID=2593676 RepID=UPI0036C8B9DB
MIATNEAPDAEPVPADDMSQPCVVHVRGDMDVDHADELRSALLLAIDSAPARAAITVDLRNSSFCDSSGLNALLTARRRALESGHVLGLAAPSHQMLRLLELSDTADLFPLGPALPR